MAKFNIYIVFILRLKLAFYGGFVERLRALRRSVNIILVLIALFGLLYGVMDFVIVSGHRECVTDGDRALDKGNWPASSRSVHYDWDGAVL